MILLSIAYSLLWVSDYVRLIFGIEESYDDFVANENNRQLKHPINYGLNVVGHDKYGFPIFGKHIGKKIKIKGVKQNLMRKKVKNTIFLKNISMSMEKLILNIRQVQQ